MAEALNPNRKCFGWLPVASSLRVGKKNFRFHRVLQQQRREVADAKFAATHKPGLEVAPS